MSITQNKCILATVYISHKEGILTICLSCDLRRDSGSTIKTFTYMNNLWVEKIRLWEAPCRELLVFGGKFGKFCI